MATPLVRGGGEREPQTWQELEDVFASLAQLARSAATPPEFYRTVLDQSVRALSAVGAVAWLRADGAMKPVAQCGLPASAAARTDEARRAHEAVLSDVIAEGHLTSVAPKVAGTSHSDSSNSIGGTNQWLLLGPVRGLGTATESADKVQRGPVVAVIELWLRGDISPTTLRGCEEYLTAVCDLAADFHAFDELKRLREFEHHRTELLELGPRVHSQLGLSATAYAVANEGRRVANCDRLSVLVARGNRCKLLAASGVSRVERRSGAARYLAKVAEQVRLTNQVAHYADGDCDALPPVAEAIARHVEESHARYVAAIPLTAVKTNNDEEDTIDRHRRRRRVERPQFVLIAEQFDSRDGELRQDWLQEVAAVSTTALYNALAVDTMPLGWLLRPLGRLKTGVSEHLSRTAIVGVAVIAAVAALVLVPADFNIEAPGTMQPTVRRDVFAPRNGIVDEVLVKHGDDVKAGTALVRMRDPSLELELKRVDGELETAQRQLDAVRAAKTNRAVRDAAPVESYRLSAEERELEQKVANSRRELELLQHERDRLVVTSPIAGRVLTWDLGHQLSARPVERGEVLVTVADVAATWQLELAIPDDRIGYVLAAQKELKADLPVRFRIGSDERAAFSGHIAEVCQMADVPKEKTTHPRPTVPTKVSLDAPETLAALGGELRPGVSARAQIGCGRRSIGYVWLHDIWDAAVEWWKF